MKNIQNRLFNSDKTFNIKHSASKPTDSQLRMAKLSICFNTNTDADLSLFFTKNVPTLVMHS